MEEKKRSELADEALDTVTGGAGMRWEQTRTIVLYTCACCHKETPEKELVSKTNWRCMHCNQPIDASCVKREIAVVNEDERYDRF